MTACWVTTICHGIGKVHDMMTNHGCCVTDDVVS